MRQWILCIALVTALPALGYGQIDRAKFKKEAPELEKSVNEIVGSVLPDFGLTDKARASYLDGYGLVFVLEIQLERAANPFYSPPAAEVKKNIERRRKELTEKVAELLKRRFSDLKGPGDSVAIILHVANYNTAIVPELPSQIIFTAKRLDADVIVKVSEF